MRRDDPDLLDCSIKFDEQREETEKSPDGPVK